MSGESKGQRTQRHHNRPRGTHRRPGPGEPRTDGRPTRAGPDRPGRNRGRDRPGRLGRETVSSSRPARTASTLALVTPPDDDGELAVDRVAGWPERDVRRDMPGRRQVGLPEVVTGTGVLDRDEATRRDRGGTDLDAEALDRRCPPGPKSVEPTTARLASNAVAIGTVVVARRSSRLATLSGPSALVAPLLLSSAEPPSATVASPLFGGQ